MSDHAYVSIKQAAELLKVHPNTISRRITAGKYTPVWVPGAHGPERHIPRWQIDGLPEPDGWSPEDHAGPDLSHAPQSTPAVVHPQPALDLSPLVASHTDLMNRLIEAERANAVLSARNAALEAELAAKQETPALTDGAAYRRSWGLTRWWMHKQRRSGI